MSLKERKRMKNSNKYTEAVHIRSQSLENTSSTFNFRHSNNNPLTNQLKEKLIFEHEKYKASLQKVRQYYENLIQNIKVSFTEEIENLQEMLSLNISANNDMDLRLHVCEEVMDNSFTNLLSQKFIYTTRVKQLQQRNLFADQKGSIIENDSLKLDNDRLSMIIEDLTQQFLICQDKNGVLESQLESISAENKTIPYLKAQIQSLRDKLDLYTGKKAPSTEKAKKGPNLYTIYKDLLEYHGDNIKNIVDMQKNASKVKNRNCTPNARSSPKLVQKPHADFKLSFEQVEKLDQQAFNPNPKFHGFDLKIKSAKIPETSPASSIPSTPGSVMPKQRNQAQKYRDSSIQKIYVDQQYGSVQVQKTTDNEGEASGSSSYIPDQVQL